MHTDNPDNVFSHYIIITLLLLSAAVAIAVGYAVILLSTRSNQGQIYLGRRRRNSWFTSRFCHPAMEEELQDLMTSEVSNQNIVPEEQYHILEPYEDVEDGDFLGQAK